MCTITWTPTLSGRCSSKVHMTSSIADSRLGTRPQRQADCRSSRTFATGSPGHTLCCEKISGNEMCHSEKTIPCRNPSGEQELTSGWALRSLVQLRIRFLAWIRSCSVIRLGSFPSSLSGQPSVCMGFFCRPITSTYLVNKPFYTLGQHSYILPLEMDHLDFLGLAPCSPA